MGLILDSSILIAGERQGASVAQILRRVRASQGEIESALSVVAIVELTHGIYRAKNDKDRERRQAFCDELRRDMVVHPGLKLLNSQAESKESKLPPVSVLHSKIC